MREISPTRARVKTATTPCVYDESLLKCRDHLHAWCRAATPGTVAQRMMDVRRFGRWQWSESDPPTVLAWLLDLPPDDAAFVIARFDEAEAHTSSRAKRKRRLHHLRVMLRIAAEREDRPAPAIAPAARDAA